jgi:excisionase family DNA binding protein
MRSRIVSVFTDALASAKVPVLDLATRYTELGEALLPINNPTTQAKYGIEISSFILENASVPPEVEAAIDKRSSMSAIGNLNDYVKYQMAQGLEHGGGGVGGTAAEIAMGMSMAQQMMQQGNFSVNAPAAAPAAAAAPGGDILTPAQVAQLLAVSEADVLSAIEAGDIKGKKIGSAWRITKGAVDEFLAK